MSQPVTSMWFPSLNPPREFLYPALLYHDQVATFSPMMEDVFSLPSDLPGADGQIFTSLRRYQEFSRTVGALHIPLTPGEIEVDVLDWAEITTFCRRRGRDPRNATEEWWFNLVRESSRSAGLSTSDQRVVLSRLADPRGGLDFIWGMKFQHEFEERLVRKSHFRRVNLEAGYILVAPKAMIEFAMTIFARAACAGRGWSAIGSDHTSLDDREIGLLHENDLLNDSYAQLTMTLPMPSGELSLERLIEFRNTHQVELENVRQMYQRELMQFASLNSASDFAELQSRMELIFEPIHDAIARDRERFSSLRGSASAKRFASQVMKILFNFALQLTQDDLQSFVTSGNTDPRTAAMGVGLKMTVGQIPSWCKKVRERRSDHSLMNGNLAYVYKAAKI